MGAWCSQYIKSFPPVSRRVLCSATHAPMTYSVTYLVPAAAGQGVPQPDDIVIPARRSSRAFSAFSFGTVFVTSAQVAAHFARDRFSGRSNRRSGAAP